MNCKIYIKIAQQSNWRSKLGLILGLVDTPFLATLIVWPVPTETKVSSFSFFFLFKLIKIGSNFFNQIQTCPIILKLVQNGSDMSKLFKTHAK